MIIKRKVKLFQTKKMKLKKFGFLSAPDSEHAEEGECLV